MVVYLSVDDLPFCRALIEVLGLSRAAAEGKRLLEQLAGGLIAALAAAGRFPNRQDFPVLDARVGDGMAQAGAVGQHDGGRAAYMVGVTAQSPFSQDRLPGFVAVKLPGEKVKVKAGLTGQIEHHIRP